MDELMPTLKETYPGMNNETVIETHWDMLPSLYRAGIRATYRFYKPKIEGTNYLEIERREYADITRWSGGTVGEVCAAYFPDANVLVMNRKIES